MEASHVEQVVEDEDACPECHSSRLVMDYVRGEVVCEACSLVVMENYIDKSPEPRSRGEERPPGTRNGSPSNITIHDKGLTTEISPGLRDSKGKPLQGANRTKLLRLSRLQRRMKYSLPGEKSLAAALMELDRMASIVEIPREFKREAALIYRRAAARGIVRGRTIRGMAASSIYIACRVMMAPRTLDELSRLLEVEKRELSLSFKAIARGLRLGLLPTKAGDFFGRVASQLNLPMETRAMALDLIRRAESVEEFQSKAPMGTVAACIYLASLEAGARVSQERIGQAAGVSEVTIRKRYIEIASKLGLKVLARIREDRGAG